MEGVIKREGELEEELNLSTPEIDEFPQIIEDEGTEKTFLTREHVSYKDSLDKPTGGVGHLLTKAEQKEYPEGEVIPQEQVDAWFEKDKTEALKDTERFLKGLAVPTEVRAIVTNMVFNIGLTRLRGFKRFKSALEKSDWETAAKEMVDSKWFRQVGRRARRLVRRMNSVAGIDDSNIIQTVRKG